MVSFNFSSLTDLQKQLEELATGNELEKADNKAFDRIKNIARTDLENSMPVSDNVAHSGRSGSRTYSHAKDYIPAKIRKKNGKKELIIGWESSDNSPYYYMKFLEFGSSKQRPQAPFKKTFEKQIKEYKNIFVEEYQKVIDKKLEEGN